MQAVLGFTTLSGGHTIVPPLGTYYNWTARVTIPGRQAIVEFAAGARVACAMSDTCLYIGDSANGAAGLEVQVDGFHPDALVVNGTYPALEDHGQAVRINKFAPFHNFQRPSTASFGELIQIDTDELATIDGMDMTAESASDAHCSTDFCEVAVKGVSGGASVIYIKNSGLTLNCTMNGVDAQGENTLRISDSVIQGQAQFAVRASSPYSNVPAVELDNVYGEVAGCAGSNPLGIGQAGLIVQGGFASVRNSVGPVGSAPVFANTGTTQYNYYIVAKTTSSGGLASAPFLAGIALTSGSGSIPVKWPQIGTTGTITYDVIRTSGIANSPAPYTAICTGGSTTTCGSVATGLTVASACAAVGSTNICSFTDTASTSTGSYTVVSPPTYYIGLPFWNGSVIYTSLGDAVGAGPIPSGVHFDRMGDNIANSGQNPVSQMVSSYGALVPKFFAGDCNALYGGSWQSCLENTEGAAAGATLLDSGAYNAADNAGEKGRLIFEEGLAGLINGGHKITIVDSNPAKTLASVAMRPTYDANDTYIALDNPSAANASGAQLAFGAPVSISNYIGSNPDNASFLERLTASGKTFNVPVSVGGNLTVNGQLLVAGPWMVSSPIPGTAMAAAGAGTSALGISNDGNFYISANAGTPQKVATTASSSYFSNLFQEDANDLGEYNGTTAQNLHVYSSYSNSSTWQRTSLGYDATDNYAVVRSENSTAGAAPGLGFWINSGLKWVVDASSNFSAASPTHMWRIFRWRR